MHDSNIFFQIHKDQLAYRTEEYKGELYRMNISCSGAESGCLFFKVAGNTSTVVGKKLCLNVHLPLVLILCTIIFSDKFNSTVLGTPHDQSDDDIDLSSDQAPATKIDITTVASESATAESTTTVSIPPIGGALFYTLIGIGGEMIIFGFIIVCVLTGLLVQKKRKSHMPSERVLKPKEAELDEDEACITRLSVPSALKPVSTHPDITVQGSAEQFYICPIMSNVCEPETENP